MKTLPVFRVAGALLLAVLLLNDAHSAEIRLKSGRTFEGTIKHITPQTVVVETGNQVLFLSADLVEMSAKDWLATAKTAFEQDNVEHAAILCRHALAKSKDLEEARELMRNIEEKRIQKARETATRAAQALADRQKALAAPPAQETASGTPAVVTPPAGENPIEGTASAPSVSEAPSASAGLTSQGLAAAETGTPAPGTLGAGFRLEGPGPAPTPSGGGGSQSIAGVFPPGFGALAGLQALQIVLSAQTQGNFAEAQTRAKVARAMSDMRSLATAIEAYNIDSNGYPPCATADKSVNARVGSGKAAYGISSFRAWTGPEEKFMQLTTPVAYITSLPQDPFADAKEATYGYWGRQGAGWILFSPGPDRQYNINPEKDYDPSKQSPQPELILKTYDATNGTTSAGDLWRIK